MFLRNLVFIFIIIASSCQPAEYENIPTNSVKDSIAVYLNVAKDKKQDLKKRLFFINKAYDLTSAKSEDTVYNKVLYRKSLVHYSLKEYDSLLYFTSLLAKKAAIASDYYHQGKAFYLKAYYHDELKHEPDSAFLYYNKSKNSFLKINDSVQVGKKLLNMAYLHENNGDYFGCKETITEALKYLTEKNDLEYHISALNVLAQANRKLLNHEDALTHYDELIRKARPTKDKQFYSNNKATVLMDIGEYEKAIQLLETLFEDSTLMSIPSKKARAVDNLAYARWLKDTIDVEKELLKALDIRSKEKDNVGLIASYTHLGKYFLQTNKQKSAEFLQEAIKSSKRVKNPKGELDALKFLMKIKPSDIGTKERYIELSDSLYSAELNVKTQFAKIRYDDKLKTEEISELKLETEKQQLALSVQRRQKIIYVLLGIIIILSLAFYLFNKVQKHKIEREKEVYKTEQRLSKRVHDFLANDISILSSYVEGVDNVSDSCIKKKLQDKLDNIYTQARDISLESSSIDLVNFQEELKNIVLQYNTNNVKVFTNVAEFEWSKLKDHQKVAIYRVIQELLVNSKKHSKCSRITLMIKSEGSKRIITYKDNGIGADLDKIKINGLANATSRMESLGEYFSFGTSPGNGFKAEIILKA